ncbi:hybrid sensor histidine kinase/response regulator [Leptospira gomenensis]|uniref:histidine kinase n=1 Tax=Leptospira gomenensis TaxID=2484974 RepID=A0A5F1YBK8_9LEPT|nr:GAF domain-containing hybrid sensor histidine kinase/response regulator [Leptospira gomenensis]TGK34518.1 hybrid sensor histidine kinase/response regulator [Leptospira gomenensis]TGK40172.1 hybrid sensor histidine kinase/response regulator [Leptospira gomenensis]TGK41903.1 hybrid sensor histidine kinase/response regulator [Leptospira gomenensis]TGK55681.1 hybrid sensor histidine kinase/response regulator [Leptospira gomenensis]
MDDNIIPVPADESARLKALLAYKILDTPAEEKFDSMTQIVSFICDTKTALISLIDMNRQWFKAKTGMADSETPRDISFCQYAILQDDIFEIEDAHLDPRFKNNPLVTGPPYIRFYAGAPLRTPEGFNVGTLCVIDPNPKRLSQKQRLILKVLAEQIIFNFELIKTNRELIAVRKKEEQLQNYKSQFFANMSHEIRTPVHGILGVAGLLAETELQVEQREYVDTIRKSGGLLLNLLNDILDFSKLESGHMKVETVSFDLVELLKDVYSLFELEARRKNVEFTLRFGDKNSLIIVSDPNRLKQVLINLISNAFKFTEKGKVCLELETGSDDGKTSEIFLRVKDTGIGIPELKLAELFQAYTQADTSVSRKYGGTGLGLAISKNLSEMMDLQLTARSTINKGSVFEISGIVNLAEKSEVSFEQKKIVFNSNGSPVQDLRILVAEDNETNQMLIRRLLEKLGYRPTIVSNGIEALHHIEMQGADVLFLDIQMPELSGIDTAKILSQHTNQSMRPYIIAITANASASDREACLNAGMDDYISKPFHKEEIAALLNKYNGKKTFP